MSRVTFSGLTSTIPAEIEEGVARLQREYTEGRAAAAECAMLRAFVLELAQVVEEECGGARGPFRELLGRARAVAGCGPCHDGRVAGSPTPPREARP